MKYLSTDIETTGLNPDTCDIIEFGCVVDDLSEQAPLDTLPIFHCYLTPDDGVFRGEPYALSMHSKIFKRIATREAGYIYLNKQHLVDVLYPFLQAHFHGEKIVIAGKNFGSFDQQFLKPLRNWDELNISHRYLDPSTLYFNPKTDFLLPSTETCCARAGLPTEVAHTTIEDAKVVIQLLRHKYPL